MTRRYGDCCPMVKHYSKLVLKKDCFLEFKIINELIGNNSFIIQDMNAKTIFEFVVEDLKGIYFEE